MAKMSPDNYAVIGVGSFGGAVVRALARNGKNVIAVDFDQKKLKDISDIATSVYQANVMSKAALEEAGVGSCLTAIVGIGAKIEASILATLACIELGVPHVISKAGSKEHGKILQKLGADVVFPEDEAGERLASNLMSRANLDILPLSDDFSIISLDVNPVFFNQSIVNLNWRKKYGVNIIAIIVDDDSNATIGPDTIIPAGSRVVLSGTNKALDRFREINAKGL